MIDGRTGNNWSTFSPAVGTHPILPHLDALDRLLVAKGFPEISAWWREALTRFYNSGARQFVGRIGRRGGKSSTLCRVAVLEALFGEHVIPPGDVGIVGIVGRRKTKAPRDGKRLSFG